jgi:hypothetical protein
MINNDVKIKWGVSYLLIEVISFVWKVHSSPVSLVNIYLSW